MRGTCFFGLSLFCLIGLSSPVLGQANSALIPRADLYGNPVKIGSNISPDGKWISWLAPVDGVMNVWVAPRDQLDAARPVTQDHGRGISASFWTYDGRHLFYTQDQNGNAKLHVYAVDINDRTTRDLTPFDNVRVTVAMVSPKRPGELLIWLNKRDPKNPDLFRADLANGSLTQVLENPGFLNVLTDDSFTPIVALKLKPTGGEEALKFDHGIWKDWLDIAPQDARSTSFLAVDSAGRNIFALDSRGRNTVALARINLATSKESVIAEDKRADIRDVAFDQKSGEPVMYSVNVARVEQKPLTPAIKRDIDFLNTQNLGDWTISSRSTDDRYWKLTVNTDFLFTAALYDRQARKVTQLYDPRPALSGAVLAHMYPVTIKARDGLDLVAYLSLPPGDDPGNSGVPDHPIPLVVLVHGGPHDRDFYGFNQVHQWLANRGYAVLSVNYRGSTGFGKNFVNASIGEWGGKLDDDLNDAVAWAERSQIADPTRVAIMGGSYGGYATLVGMTRDASTYACGVDLYGLSDMTLVGPSQAAYLSPGAAMYFNELGDPNTDEGRALTKDRSPVTHADQIRKSLLVAQGANDPFVVRKHSDEFVAAAKAQNVPVTYLLYPDEGHGFARAENNLSFYAVAEQFLGKCLGGRAEPITADSLKGSSMQVLEGGDQIAGLETALAARDASVARPQIR